MSTRMTTIKWTAALAAVAACGGGGGEGDESLGAVEQIVEFGDRINWPGKDRAGGRVIPLIRGFGNGRPAAYWFLGFASRRTADSFWFCREGETLCPLDEHRRLNWDALQGNPIFTRLPGDAEFSPFWQMWRVTVPDGYVPNTIKHPDTLDEWKEQGRVTVEPFIRDFGDFFFERVGPQEVVLHCALVLEDTTLAENGGPMPDGRGPMRVLETRQGWFESYVVNFIDFSPSDGVFPEAEDSESRPLMRFADIFIMWRQCAADPRPPICDFPNHAYADRRPVSERGLGQDFTDDGDMNDTNNTLGALPCELLNPASRPYSPLWGPLAVDIVAAADEDFRLIDTFGDQAESTLQSEDTIRKAVETGQCLEPVEMTEDEDGNPIPGNEGRVFFNCPNPVWEDFLPSCP